jgi:hypothetical protein
MDLFDSVHDIFHVQFNGSNFYSDSSYSNADSSHFNADISSIITHPYKDFSMTSYIKLSTGEYPRHIGDIEIDSAGSADYAHVEWVDRPSFDRATQRCYEGLPVQENGTWYTTWVVRDATPDEIEAFNKSVTPLKRVLK